MVSHRFFQSIVDANFLQTGVQFINEYVIEVLCSPKTKEKSHIMNWKDVRLEEIQIFLALLLQTGTTLLCRLNDYSVSKETLFLIYLYSESICCKTDFL